MAVLKTIPCQNNPFLEFPPHLSMLLMAGEKCILINFYNDFEESEKMADLFNKDNFKKDAKYDPEQCVEDIEL